jgi:hypothetical protein
MPSMPNKSRPSARLASSRETTRSPSPRAAIRRSRRPERPCGPISGAGLETRRRTFRPRSSCATRRSARPWWNSPFYGVEGQAGSQLPATKASSWLSPRRVASVCPPGEVKPGTCATHIHGDDQLDEVQMARWISERALPGWVP